jgi:replication factor A1|tara:strand:+ start:199 stop:1206 length:1008 start_codon:yes stop_codon:yes gene_type:complete
MIKIPYEQIIERIKQEGKISESEINGKIDAKMKQLSGLISKEGAAHIVANELGIKLFDAFTGKLQIKNILAGLRNVETVGKVLQTYELREFKTNDRDGKVASLVIGDETGTIRVVMWGEQAENIKNISKDMSLKIVGAYVKDNNGNIELHLNDRSKVILNPEGEIIKSVKQYTAERKTIDKLTENDGIVEILGTIVQIFDPRFFEICPQCSKRAKNAEGVFSCPEHNNIEPDYSYVLNLIVDDGTENIRTVFFRDSMEKLINSNKEKILMYKDNPEKFEEVKTELLGNIVKINGRVKKNLFFDRIEILANEVLLNPDPEEEIKRLDDEVKKVESN